MLETAALALRGDQDRDGWEARALAAIRRWRTQAEAGVPGATDALMGAVRAALAGSAAEGAAQALAELPGRTVDPPPGERGLRLSEDRLGVQLASTLQQAPRMLEQVLREAVRAGVDEVRAGKATRRNATQQVLNRLVRNGITGFRDSAGRNWSLTSYAEMAVRTETQARALAAGDASIRAAGLDLVVVSDSPRECDICRPFEGQVLSLNGDTGTVTRTDELTGQPVKVKIYTTLADARARGYQHPNCTHSHSAFIPGVTKRRPADSNPDGYAAKEHQRYLERKIREWKRMEVTSLDPAAQAAAKAKVRDWQAALRKHVKDNDLKRLPGRESIKTAV